MLTLILLVVLGGGVGILAVSMAERKPATNALDSRRARSADDGAPVAVDTGENTGDDTDDDTGDTAEAAPVPQPAQPVVPTPAPAPAPVTAPLPSVTAEPEPQSEPRPHRPADRRPGPGPERRLRRGDVPRSQTAVEGELGDLLRPSITRRFTSLVGVVLIVIGVGVGIAAFLGAIVGGLAELFGNAI